MFEPAIRPEDLVPNNHHWVGTGYEGEVYLMDGERICLALDGCTPPPRIKQMVRVWMQRDVQPD